MAKYITLDGLGTFLSKLKDGSYKASTSEFGAIKIGYTQSGKNYPVQLDTNGKAYVNVPWSDSNTDTKVTQTVTTSNASYPLLLAPSSQTATTTTTSYFDSGVTLNPSTNTIAANISGNATTATTATKLGTATKGASNKPIYLNAGAPTEVSSVGEAFLSWGGTNIKGSLSPLDVAMDGQWSANRLSFMPASDIKIEYSTDSGTTWTDYEASDNQKQSLVTTGLSHSIKPGKKDTRQLATKDRVRVTITASSGKTYFSLKKIYIYMSQNGANGCKVLLEKANCTTGTTTFATVGTYDISGWSGWNSIPYTVSFGGGNTQTSNIRTIRLTYYFETYADGYGEADSTSGVTSTIQKINMIGETSWANSGGSLASTGHLYYWDSYKNATFPANVTATTFIGSLSGTATNATNVNIATSSSDASYPLLFTSNVTAGNKRIYTDSANDLSYNPSTNELSTNGDIRIKAGNTNRFITFDSNDSLKNSWRIGYFGSGSGDANYLSLQSSQSTGTFVDALQISNVNLTSKFSGDILPSTNNAKSLGSSSLKWANAYATTFHGALDGNATSATKLGTTTIGSASKPIYLSSGTPTACTSIDNSFISKTGGTSTLAWNSEVTLATIAGQAIKAKLPANPNTDTNTAHKHAVGVGLICDNTTGTTSGTVTYKAKLKSETASTLDSASITATASRQYAVGVDKSGYLSVNVPWSNTTYSAATTSAAGLMSAADKTKLDGIATGANKYTLPTAATGATGGIKIAKDNSSYAVTTATSSISADVTSGKYYGVEIDKNDKAFVYVPWTNTTYTAATTSAAGLMSAADKTKLDGIAAGANNYTLPTATTGATGGIKVAGTRSSAITTTQGGTAGSYYGIERDSNGKAFVNVPSVKTGSTDTYGVLKVKTGDLSDITSNADSIAASYYHNHDKKYAASGHTHSDASESSKGFVKLVNSDLYGSTHVNGQAAGLGHTHSQYADQYIVASALTDLDYRITAITRNAASGGASINLNSTDLVLGSAVYEYAAKKSHATTATTYGLATTSNYGHVKISNGDVSAIASGNGLAAGMDHYHSKTRISTSSANGYYPMLFVNATTSGDTAILIDSSTGTGSTSSGIRYNPSGNTCYCSGGFFEASDERLKNFGDDINIDLDKLAQLPKKYFTWKHDKDGKVHIGTSAQELQKIYPELVDTLEDGTLIVSYDTLSVIALKGVDVLYEKYKSLEERLNKIEKMLG